MVKEKVKEKAYEELTNIQMDHSKVRNIMHENLNEPQGYLKSKIFTNKMSKLLFNMRCQSVKGIRNNFHNFYNENINCPFKCQNSYDTQAHVLSCPKLIEHLSQDHKNDLNSVQYSDIFGSLLDQSKVIISFQQLMRVRERLLEESQEPACHGNSSGP